MNRVLEQMRKEFQGNADALVLAAQEVVQKLNIAQEASEGNERLVRHYVQVAAVDRGVMQSMVFVILCSTWQPGAYLPKGFRLQKLPATHRLYPQRILPATWKKLIA
ncbi:MAG: hypothetical protein EBS61_13205 [Betaproteobacteria bacterium]|nr:hypothetical protein [Betaproteobacteria bacterium]